MEKPGRRRRFWLRRLGIGLALAVLLMMLGGGACAKESVWGTEGVYTTRNGQRFFAIGVNINGWGRNQASEIGVGGTRYYPSQKEFSSAVEIFNVLKTRVPSPSDPLPAWFYVRGKDCAIISGHGYFEWRLRSDDRLRESKRWTNRLGPQDQRQIVRRLMELPDGDPATPARQVEHVWDLFKGKDSLSSRGDLLYYLSDEPERGFDSWHFPGELMEMFHRAVKTAKYPTLTYIDLGPMSGNNYLWELKYPDIEVDNDLERYDQPHYWGEKDFRKNVITTARHYRDACDVIGINTYTETSAEPELLGEAVQWLHQATGDKPNWVWVAAHRKKIYYRNDLDVAYARTRQQVYAAIAHRTSGIMFWGERSSSHRYWDVILDVAKELQLHRHILENSSDVKEISGKNSEGRAVGKVVRSLEDSTRYFLFAVNNDRSPRTLDADPYLPAVTLEAGACGVWTVLNGRMTRLSHPLNLGFERDLFTDSAPRAGAWRRVEYGDAAAALVQSDSLEAKTGKNFLLLSDDSPDQRCSAEQFMSCIPGASYRLQAWYKHLEGKPQSLIIQFYNGDTWLRETAQSAETADDWNLVQLEATAPPGADRLKIYLGSSRDSQRNRGQWDDVMIKLTAMRK